jgi:5,10-methylenetetrahydromethanopterin reductase
LNELFPGRVSLCLGVGAPVDLANAGIEAKAPLRPMREAIRLCRSLLAGETVHHEGERFQVQGQALSVGCQPVPILLAASGPRMLQLAGAETDGIVLSAGASVQYLEWCIDQARPTRAATHVRVHAFVYTAVSEDPAAAYDRMRRPLSTTLQGAHHAPNLEMAGSQLNQPMLIEAIAAGDHTRADSLIDDEIVRHHAAAGGAAEAASRIGAYRAAGADNIVLPATRSADEIRSALAAAKL